MLAGLNANMAVNSSVYATLAYDPIRDFTAVGMMAEFPFVLVVSKDFPAKSVKELIEMAKAKPGEINAASAGNGSGQHLSLELFKLMTGTNITHVPYRGASPAYTDVISGRTPVFFDNLSSALGQIKSGNVRALAVTGKERSPSLPDVPTVAESGVPGYQNYVWFGLWAPKKTPQAIIDKLHAEVTKAIADPEMPEAHHRGRRRADDDATGRDRTHGQSRDRQMGRRRQTRQHIGSVVAPGRRDDAAVSVDSVVFSTDGLHRTAAAPAYCRY